MDSEISSAIFFEGTHRLLGGYITLVKVDEKRFCIERIEVDVPLRRTGEATKMIQKIANLAAANSINLSACICPDSKDRKVTIGLQNAFSKAGFQVYEDDGEVYPNDVFFECKVMAPKKMKM